MNWILELLNKLFFWVPRFYFLGPDEAGVRTIMGNRVEEIGPGWYIDWPVIHNFTVVSTAIQGVRFAAQSVMTKDNVDMCIRGVLLYKITNARKAIYIPDDFDGSLEALSCGIIEEFTADKSYLELHDREALKAEILKGIRDTANDWGIKIRKVLIGDIGKVTNIRILSDEASTIIPIESGE